MSKPSPSSLVGAVFERNVSSPSPLRASVGEAPSTGFPAVQHRSKSAFARNRNMIKRMPLAEPPIVEKVTESKTYRDDIVGAATAESPLEPRENALESNASENVNETKMPVKSSFAYSSPPPTPSSSTSHPPMRPNPSNAVALTLTHTDDDGWKTKMSAENTRVVEEMSEEERERQRAEILEQLGPDISTLIRKAREARENTSKGIVHPSPNRPHAALMEVPKGILVSAPSSRSTTPGVKHRKLRFADVKPDDIHVFPSEPSSPKRTPIALLPPPSSDDSSAIKLASSTTEKTLIEDIRRNHNVSHHLFDDQPVEEGTPEDIRRRFFPHLSPREPALEWIEGDSASSTTSFDSNVDLRFDLMGCVIPPDKQASLPTYLGLHHHGIKPNVAGYTLGDLYFLARSSVPSQRATILNVLSKIVHRLSHGDPGVEDVVGREDEIRRDALVAGLAALTEKGSLVIQAIDLVWSCIVDWDAEDTSAIENVELRPFIKSRQEDEDVDLPSRDPLSSLPLTTLLPQLNALVLDPSLPPESHSQLLGILSRLSRHSSAVATAMCENVTLIGTVMKTFVQTPIPVVGNALPDPRAISLLRNLAAASRSNARSLRGIAEILLRFATTCVPPQESPFPTNVAVLLLQETLKFYATLAQFGLGCNVATTASHQLSNLSSYLLGELNTSVDLTSSYLRLIDVWMVCARDPHRTTPHHDILWSQVQAWGWGECLTSFKDLLATGRFNAEAAPVVWGAYWGAIAAWIEGCRVNSVRAGFSERAETIRLVEKTWQEVDETGVAERTTIQRSITCVRQALSHAPPFVAEESRWKHFSANLKYSTSLLAFSRFLYACVSDKDPAPATPVTVTWMQDATNQFSLLRPSILKYVRENVKKVQSGGGGCNIAGDIAILRPFSGVLANITDLHIISSKDPSDWILYALSTPEALLPGEEDFASRLVQHILTEAGLEDVELGSLSPFLKHEIRPFPDVYISPCISTPVSIENSTSLLLPSDCLSASTSGRTFGLPLNRDWLTIGLDHVLRSGSSPIFSHPEKLPKNWNFSESDIACATLKLMKNIGERFGKDHKEKPVMSLEQIVFTCMKVFMLEHEQHQNKSSSEVFRTPAVETLMKDVLQPFTYESSGPQMIASTQTLEDASKSFLGTGTPFFQFYTDFVALYDAISFMHPTFARLLLTPTSMRYPLDYRKHLWGDFGHLLRTIRTSPADVISSDLNEFLWPFEADAEMLGWYLRALVRWPLEGFVRLVAVHHVACNLWPDLREDSGQVVREKRVKMLLNAVVNQTSLEVLSDVARYTQVRGGEVSLEPRCFDCDGRRKALRLQVVSEYVDPQMIGRLESVFAS